MGCAGLKGGDLWIFLDFFLWCTQWTFSGVEPVEHLKSLDFYSDSAHGWPLQANFHHQLLPRLGWSAGARACELMDWTNVWGTKTDSKNTAWILLKMKSKIDLQLTHDLYHNCSDKQTGIPIIGGKAWNTGQHAPKVLLVANVIASCISLGPVLKLVKFPMKLRTLVNSRKEQDLWVETIPSQNPSEKQPDSIYCTKKLHKEKGSPSVMACDSSVRSETQDSGRIGRCLFQPWKKGYRF